MKNITWINVLLGVWLLIAPFALSTVGAHGVWTANDIVLGVMLIVASAVIVSTAAPSSGIAWFEVLCGVWLIIAPFALRYANGPKRMSNDVVSGVIAIVVAAIAIASTHQHRRVTA